MQLYKIMKHFSALLIYIDTCKSRFKFSVGEVVYVNQRWFPLLSCRCVQYSRHCWNYSICTFLVFDSWIFWYNFIYTTIQFKNLCIGELLFYVEMLLRRVVIWRVVIWRNVLWRNVIWQDVTEPNI